MPDRLLVLDAHNLIYRAYYALPYLSTSQGRPTNAAFGFTSMLLSLLAEFNPDYVAIATDVPAEEPSFRERAYPQYKANRPPMPEDLVAQLPLVERIGEALRIPTIGIANFEADDIMGTLAAWAEAEGVETILATGDRDAYQLVSDLTRVCTSDRSLRQNIVIDRQKVADALGVPPEQVPDFKALTGDPSDNIPGVSGIGPKRAVELLHQFGSLEGILDHLDQIRNPRWREALEQGADLARQWKEICRIVRDVPLPTNLGDLRWTGPDEAVLRDLFDQLEFRTLLQRALPQAEADKGEPEEDKEWVRVEDEAAAKRAAQAIRKRGRCAVFLLDGEAVGGIALCAGTTGTFFFAYRPESRAPTLFDHPIVGEQLAAPALGAGGASSAPTGSPLSTLLADSSVEKIGHDTKELERKLAGLGLTLAGVEFDTLLAAYLLSPGESDLSLTRVAKSYLNLDLPTLADAAAACSAARALWQLREPLLSQLKNAGLADLFFDVELPLARVLAKMEARGVRVDVQALRTLGGQLADEIFRSEQEVYRLAGERFTIGSPKQLQVILFEKLKLPAGRKTKTGYSTDADVLAELAPKHEIVRHILDYRAASKLKSTYADALADLVDSRTGRIHTRFNQAAVATGRLSSSDPNLQNIPVRTEAGRMVRRCFVAPSEGDLLLSCDYSQIELRILAHFSEDPGLCAAFQEGQDIHVQTAAQVFGVAPEEVTSDMRNRAKTVNFGVIYGMGPVALARQLGISREEARDFIERYFSTFQGVRQFIDATIARARTEGYVTTLLGRRRYLPELRSERNEVRAFGERAAVNTPIQGTAADMIKIAMLGVDQELEDWPAAHLVLQVHDELLLEVPRDRAADLAKRVCETMAGVVELRVPVEVEAKVGPNWGELVSTDEHG